MIYVIFVAMSWPFQPIATALGADYSARHHGPFNGQRWFLLMLVFARIYNSSLNVLRCPGSVQVAAAGLGVLCFELLTHSLHDLRSEPDGRMWAWLGYPALGRPPYVGNTLVGSLFPSFILRFLFYHSFAYHYLRHLRLVASRAVRQPHVVAVAVLASSLIVEAILMPLNNHFPIGLDMSGLGTPRAVSWYVVETLTATSVALGLLSVCYLFPSRLLELLGQCTLPAFLLHGIYIHRTRELIRTLPRIPQAEGLSALVWLFVMLLLTTVAAGIVVHGIIWLVRALVHHLLRARLDETGTRPYEAAHKPSAAADTDATTASLLSTQDGASVSTRDF